MIDYSDYSYLDGFSYFLEAANSSYLFRDNIYPNVEAVLSTPQGNKDFREMVRKYIDRNATKLNTAGPVYLVPFTDNDKNGYFKLFNINKADVVKVITEYTKSVTSMSDWKLMRNNPIFFVFYCCIRYYTITKNESGVNTALAIYALAAFPSVMDKYFKYGANPAVMQYTIDHMTEKFMIKQKHTLLATLCASITNSYQFLKPDFDDMEDIKVTKFIQRIRNDQNSMMKKIKNEFNKNYQDKKAIRTQSDSFSDTGDLVVDNDNDSTIIERISNKVTISILTNGVDLARAEAAGRISGISLSECRLYLTRVFTEDRVKEISEFIESVLYKFIYADRYKESDINSKTFLIWASELYRKTNSDDANIARIKKTLDKWAEEIGIHAKFHREASRNCYKRAIFLYIIMIIQKNNG